MLKPYYIWDNAGAGLMVISRHCPGFHFSIAQGFKPSKSFMVLKNTLEQHRIETTVYAVFYNIAAGDGYVSEESELSGNYKGSKHGHYNFCGEYASYGEAQEALNKLLGVI